MKVPKKADVSFVGEYNPTKFEFRKEDYWIDKQLEIESFE